MDQLFLMLIAITDGLKRDGGQLAAWMDEIEGGYMDEFAVPSVAHVALQGPFDFALLFRSSPEGVMFLENAIRERGGSGVWILTMPATELDEYPGRAYPGRSRPAER